MSERNKLSVGDVYVHENSHYIVKDVIDGQYSTIYELWAEADSIEDILGEDIDIEQRYMPDKDVVESRIGYQCPNCNNVSEDCVCTNLNCRVKNYEKQKPGFDDSPLGGDYDK